jgi:hypothetical protein
MGKSRGVPLIVFHKLVSYLAKQNNEFENASLFFKQANIHLNSTAGSETTSQRLTTYIRIDVIKQNYII